jgi:hypothetical protein
MTLRVLVTGGRSYQDRAKVYSILDRALAAGRVGLIIHGAAQGADTLAWDWAEERNVDCLPIPAKWRRFDGTTNRGAGPIRNGLMLRLLKPDLILAFPGGNGTADMKKQARAAGVRMVEVT